MAEFSSACPINVCMPGFCPYHTVLLIDTLCLPVLVARDSQIFIFRPNFSNSLLNVPCMFQRHLKWCITDQIKHLSQSFFCCCLSHQSHELETKHRWDFSLPCPYLHSNQGVVTILPPKPLVIWSALHAKCPCFCSDTRHLSPALLLWPLPLTPASNLHLLGAFALMPPIFNVAMSLSCLKSALTLWYSPYSLTS